ncbi:MAG: LysE family translocator [Candidatus Dependentiae bacterium]|nr:LysE family translocator [Candidatus Dependentiae bacterium]
MSTLYLLLKTFIVGFAVAAPVGPIGLLSIRISLTDGLLAGYAAGLGVACADVVYASIAIFGLAALSTFILSFRSVLVIVGGCYLVYMGLGFLRRPACQLDAAHPATSASLTRTVLSMFLLTLANPATLITYFGIFSALEIPLGFLAHVFAVCGLFLGSLTWWMTLSTLVSMTKRHLPSHLISWVNCFSGIIVTLFGLLVIMVELYRL